jgi:hypothetical protein
VLHSALLLEVDRVGLVRTGKQKSCFALGQ